MKDNPISKHKFYPEWGQQDKAFSMECVCVWWCVKLVVDNIQWQSPACGITYTLMKGVSTLVVRFVHIIGDDHYQHNENHSISQTVICRSNTLRYRCWKIRWHALSLIWITLLFLSKTIVLIGMVRRRGNVWLGTWDGINFTHFPLTEGWSGSE